MARRPIAVLLLPGPLEELELREQLAALRARVDRLEGPPAGEGPATSPGGIILTE